MPACGKIESVGYQKKEHGELLARFVDYHLSGSSEGNHWFVGRLLPARENYTTIASINVVSLQDGLQDEKSTEQASSLRKYNSPKSSRRPARRRYVMEQVYHPVVT